jgi:hypothetical protein
MFSFALSIRAIPLSSQSALLPSSASDTNVKFYRIEFEELPDVSNELDSPPLPTFLLYKNGEVVTDIITVKPRDLREKIESFVEEVN